MILFTSILILLNLNQGPNADSKVDNWGHLGGLVTGILAGLAICEFMDQSAKNNERTPSRFTEEEYKQRGCGNGFLCSWCGTFSLVTWLVTLLGVFYLYVDVNQE